jgi:hypothetical protein
MFDIVNFEFVALLALVVTAVTQTIKRHPKITGNQIPYLSAMIGIIMSYLWYFTKNDFYSKNAWLHVDWMDIYRAFCNGIVATTTAWIGYQAQKAAPFPNMLPTSTELSTGELKEEVIKHAAVVDAVEQGIDPSKAKKTMGMDQSDPPPNEVLEAIQPVLPPEHVEEIIG